MLNKLTNEQLDREERLLHEKLHPMPNNEERSKLFSKWIKVRSEQSLRLYGVKNEIN